MNSLVTLYDARMFRELSRELYDYSDFYNWGYWQKDTGNAAEASRNLVEMLLSIIPNKEGNILDVGCGMGATARHLCNYYEPGDVVGINISEKQLQQCTINAPDCTFLAMDACHTAFPDHAFDNVICVESAFHFKTRETFLHEAYRILKPGGFLVLSDIVLRTLPRRAKLFFPEANQIRDLAEYAALYRQAGFAAPTVVNATKETWRSFRRHVLKWGWTKVWQGQVSPRLYTRVSMAYVFASLLVKTYMLVSARKPHK